VSSYCHSLVAVTGQVNSYRRGFESGALGLSGSGVSGEDAAGSSKLPVTTHQKRKIEVNMEQHPEQQPVVGHIYRDKSGSSLVVVNVAGGKVLLEYANGTVTSVDDWNWQQLHPQISAY
jgi:hypothetical protein